MVIPGPEAVSGELLQTVQQAYPPLHRWAVIYACEGVETAEMLLHLPRKL